jgi:hypothetical protein
VRPFSVIGDDYAYLATQNFVRSESIFQYLGPREEARLHALIKMSKPRMSPLFGPKIVTDALKEFISHRRGRKCTRASSGSIPGDIFDVGEACAILLAILPFHSHMWTMINPRERQRGELGSFRRPRFQSFFSA